MIPLALVLAAFAATLAASVWRTRERLCDALPARSSTEKPRPPTRDEQSINDAATTLTALFTILVLVAVGCVVWALVLTKPN